jgi:hypothetical protein
MGQPTPSSPVLLLLAAFSRYEAALAWARDRACLAWGPVGLESPSFLFDQTDYYRPTMGPGLRKIFWAFARPFDPGKIAEVKLQTNQWEQDYARQSDHTEPRPLNLDPGYLTLGKLVLASTKDHAQRIYLARGIYAEVTLSYRHGGWQPHPWTFADYRRRDYQEFFSECRELLRRVQQEGGQPEGERQEGSARCSG